MRWHVLLLCCLTPLASSYSTSIPVLVTDFGAVGDGVANDWPAIQEAVDAALAGARVVLFPAGTFRYDTAPCVAANVDN